MRSIFAYQLILFCFIATGYVVKGHYMFVLYMVSFVNGFIMFEINTLFLVFNNAKGDPFDHSTRDWIDLVISVLSTFAYFFALGHSDIIGTAIIQHARRKRSNKMKKSQTKKRPKGLVLNVVGDEH